MTSKNALNKLAMLARRGNYTDKEFNTILHDLTYIVLKDLEYLKKLKKEYNTIKYCHEKLTKDYDSLKKDFNELLETNNIFYNTKEKYKNAIASLKEELYFEFHEPSKSFDFYTINLKMHKDDNYYTTIILDSDEKDKFFTLKEVLKNE